VIPKEKLKMGVPLYMVKYYEADGLSEVQLKQLTEVTAILKQNTFYRGLSQHMTFKLDLRKPEISQYAIKTVLLQHHFNYKGFKIFPV
jgi:hypothetical protein